MVRGAVLLLVVALCSMASSCADEPQQASAASFCNGVCRGANRCDSRVATGTCFSNCVRDPLNDFFVDVRPEAAATIGACVEQLDCPTIFNGPYDACWDRAREQTPPSAHLVSFCQPYSTSAFECGYWFSVEDCQARLNVWTDEFLNALAACTQLATCEETDACLEREFGS